MSTYYNEIEPFAAQWLRNLIAADHIAPGDVDTRDIREVKPDDLRGYTQCHFFAGIGGWSLALRLAGWDDARPVWTGSCPCQPFSAAGKRKGTADERHLWPEFRRLIAECRPPIAFGEQVASKDGRLWLAGVRADLEALGYATGGGDLCSAGVGAPHIRQRLWWVADSMCSRAEHASRQGLDAQAAADGEDARLSRERLRPRVEGASGGLADADPQGQRAWVGHDSARHRTPEFLPEHSLSSGRMEHPDRQRCDGEPVRVQPGAARQADFEITGASYACGLGDALGSRLEIRRSERSDDEPERATADGTGGHAHGLWGRYDTVPCLDGKARRIEPGSFPLAHGIPGRVGRLRAYGNAINPWLAAEFIAAFCES